MGCSVCGDYTEYETHFFSSVPFYQGYWFSLDLSIRSEHIQPQGVRFWLTSCLQTSSNHTSINNELIIPVNVMLCAIWLTKNQVIFHNLHPNPLYTFQLVKKWLRECYGINCWSSLSCSTKELFDLQKVTQEMQFFGK